MPEEKRCQSCGSLLLEDGPGGYCPGCLLQLAVEPGCGESGSKLSLAHVYEELRRLAAAKMAHEKPGQTLQPTALVHEAWLRLIGPSERGNWQSCSHFFAAAAEAMRRILIERARKKNRAKHGGGWQRLDWEKVEVAVEMPSDKLLALDEALRRLAEVDSTAAQLIKLRFFAGQSHQQAAGILGITRRQADGVWAFARAWLFRELRRE